MHDWATTKLALKDKGLNEIALLVVEGVSYCCSDTVGAPWNSFWANEASSRRSVKIPRKAESKRARKSFRPPTSPNIIKMSKTTRFYIVTFSER